MTALFCPYLIVALFVVSVVALLMGRFKTAIIVIVTTVLLNLLTQSFPTSLKGETNIPLEEGMVSVLSFNIHGPGPEYDKYEKDIASLIVDRNSDFIFLSEYFTSICSDTVHNRICRAGYECIDRNNSTGNAIYSKVHSVSNYITLPSASTGTLVEVNSGVTYTQSRLYCCHLSSNNYDSEKQYSTPDNIDDYVGLKAYLSKVRAASELRGQEVDSLLKRTELGDTPIIVLGDMNDVSGSPAMRRLQKAGFKDAWWEGGFGYGATIHNPLPFRIDHILYNDGLKLKQIKKISSNGWSDHDALFAVFEIKK